MYSWEHPAAICKLLAGNICTHDSGSAKKSWSEMENVFEFLTSLVSQSLECKLGRKVLGTES